MQSIVFTDTKRLGNKYDVSQDYIHSLLSDNLLKRSECEFLLLDASEYEEITSKSHWRDYKAILSDFYLGMGIKQSPQILLFIIGGDDVIPMPRIANPIDQNSDSLHADLLYCFQNNNIRKLDANEAQCSVARLPLENGKMQTSVKDDLLRYFNLAGMFLEEGIEVNKVAMTSTQSWLPASNEMVRGLPVEASASLPEMANDKLYISPRVDIDDSKVIKHYVKEIKDADMLLFNLHGSNQAQASSFYGESEDGQDNPEAFSTQLLSSCNARVFNTVACYGGRFVGYSRDESMLLLALYGNGVMLYAGSCTCALGRSGVRHNTARDMLVPAGMSESFMKLYSLYLFQGMTAGEAFLHAKCDYFNTCRRLDGDDNALATVLMFNLYGMPALKVRQNADVVQEARGAKLILPIEEAGVEYKMINVESHVGGLGLLDQIRNSVDRNLMQIKSTVESKLYSYWGLNPDNLSSIEQINKRGFNVGYRFTYDMSDSVLTKRSWAISDSLGNIKDVIHYK